MDAYKEIFAEAKRRKIKTAIEFTALKLELAKKHHLKALPSNIQVAASLPEKERRIYRYLLSIKPSRSQSGISAVAIMTKPSRCPHGKCSYCPGGVKSYFGSVPQSYTGKEPAAMRAIRSSYDPYIQVFTRLEQYALMNKDFEKVELIIMGGTFPAMPAAYCRSFVAYALKAMNDFGGMFINNSVLDIKEFLSFFEQGTKSKAREAKIIKKILALKGKANLLKEQERNEKAAIRCVGMTVESRPDYAMRKHAKAMLSLGATRFELGVQTIYDGVLAAVERGHKVADTIKATRVLKDLGFKINYHVMPGLPGLSYEKDLAGLREYFANPAFQPDMLKIYPCMVLKGTKLYSSWKKGEFSPLSTEAAAKMIAEFKASVPEYVRIMRIQRDIPSNLIEAGVSNTNLRQFVESKMRESGTRCRCIRCREPKGKAFGSYKLKVQKYEASNGIEYFISAESSDTLLGFCRLRIAGKKAFLRELHVYGEAAQIGKAGTVQHRGIGKKLLARAEAIAAKASRNKLYVISGIGVREYYRKLGYRKSGYYMAKKL